MCAAVWIKHSYWQKKQMDHYICYQLVKFVSRKIMVFVCDSLDVSDGDTNHVTFIFPLNLEHGSHPCRIQN